LSEEESQEVPHKSPKEKPIKKTTEVLNIAPEGLKIKSAPCPVPAEHVKLFEECCDKYEKGEMTDTEVMEKVRTTLKDLKKEE